MRTRMQALLALLITGLLLGAAVSTSGINRNNYYSRRIYNSDSEPKTLATAPPSPTPTETLPPLPPPAPTDLPHNSLCMNYGHYTNDYDLSGRVNDDLNNLRHSGINCIRLAYEKWNYGPMLELAAFANSQGFWVILGGSYGNVSEDDLELYRDAVLDQARWAEVNKIDQFSLGNEQESDLDISKHEWYEFLLDLASNVRDVYSGVISYEASGDDFYFWLDKPLGDVDMLGFNMYSGYAFNLSRIEAYIAIHGRDHVYISETNADMDLAIYHDDALHAAEVERNTLELLKLGISLYYFTYAACGVDTPNYWGLYQCGGELKQPLTAQLLGVSR